MWPKDKITDIYWLIDLFKKQEDEKGGDAETDGKKEKEGKKGGKGGEKGEKAEKGGTAKMKKKDTKKNLETGTQSGKKE